MSRVPHGRAPGQIRDDRIDAEDSLSSRSRELPKTDGWLITGRLNQVRSITATNAITVDTLYMIDLPPMDRDHALYEARVGCSGAVAATRIRGGVYVFVRDDVDPYFLLIPPTRVDFDTSVAPATPIVAILPEAVTLHAGHRYYLGALTTGGGARPTVTVLTTGSSRVWADLSMASSTIPDKVQMSALTKTYTADIPTVAYASRDAARVH